MVRANEIPSVLPGYWQRHVGTGDHTQHGSPSGDRGVDQLAARERKAGPTGMAEGLAVLRKPGNAGGGKGPQLKADARSDEGREIGDEPDNSRLFSEVADGVTCNGLGDCVSLLREPDAECGQLKYVADNISCSQSARPVR
jgi:hypothetical protein